MYAFRGRPLINKENEIKLAEDIFIHTEVMVLYFSGSWCSECENITPILIDLYENAKKRCLNLDIINIPIETSYSDAVQFFATQGDWVSLIHGDILITELCWSYATHIPNIIVLSREGRPISKNGYQELLQNGINCLIKWV